MNFDLTEEQQQLRAMVAEFAGRELAPVADEIDREDRFPFDIFRRLGELGLLGISVPEEYGGAGADLLSGVIALEEVAKVCPAAALSYVAHENLCLYNIYRNGTEAQRLKYLPPLCTGEHVGALTITEPCAGSDAVGMRTTARLDGNTYILNGSKTFITNGPIARTLVVYAKTAPERGAQGITAFIIESGFPGFSVGKKLEKVGNRGSQTSEIYFEDCRVPAGNVLGRENEGSKVLMSGLDLERAFVAAIALGLAEGAFELAVGYSMERRQFGQPICEFELIQGKLADMYTQIEASRLLTYRATVMAEKLDEGRRISKDAAAAILFAAETATRVALDAVQIHGGYGYTLEYPVQRFLRDAKLYEIGAGTSEIRRIVIARELVRERRRD